MITAQPDAPLGSVTKLREYTASTFRSSDAVLCRNFAPLVKLAFQLIRKGVPCRVLGSEFATQLEDLVDKSNTSDISSLRQWLEAHCDEELAAALKKNKQRLAQIIEEKYGCLLYLASQESTIQSLLYTLKSMFNDKASGYLTLSTIHKAKGLEWSRVFFLDPQLIPSKYATQAWELAQETNLKYVGVTRAKIDLVYIESDKWEGQETTKEIREWDGE